MKFENSLRVYDRSLNVIPMGTSTFSRNPHLCVMGKAPLYFKFADGCRVFDVDGNDFIDYSMALGVINIGYNNVEVNEAAKRGIDEGLIYTLSCPEESLLAQKLCEIIPCAEMVRFCKNGSDSCEGAVRLARNFTGKKKIVTVGGYHGFHDWYIVSTARKNGIPGEMCDWVIPCKRDDIDEIENTIRLQSGQIAALIMEPAMNEDGQEEFVERIRKVTEECGVLLIFDEMKTGFRFDLAGAQKYFGVTADIAIFGKGLSNGFPISALVGRKEIVGQFEDENCFFSGSYATEKASINAALKTIEILETQPVIEHIWEKGQMLKDGCVALVNKHNLQDVIRISGYAPMMYFMMSGCGDFTVNEIKSFIQQESVKRGVFFVGYHHVCYAHKSEDIEYTLKVYDEVLGMLKNSLDDGNVKSMIEGETIGSFGVRNL